MAYVFGNTNIVDLLMKQEGADKFKIGKFVEEATIPSSKNEISNCEFENFVFLKKVIFDQPSSVVGIKHRSFAGCLQLVEITIPTSVKYIETEAFLDCKSLQIVNFAEPSSLKNIVKRTFCNCESLKKIRIPASVKTIRNYAFDNCRFLRKVEITSHDTRVEYYAFDYFTNIVYI